jgi:hypothetical protein
MNHANDESPTIDRPQQTFNESLRVLDLAQQNLIKSRVVELDDGEAVELLTRSQEITENIRMVIG